MKFLADTTTNTRKIINKKTILGIDIGSSVIRASIVNNNICEYSLEVNSDGVERGYIVDNNKFKKSIEILFTKIIKKYETFPKNIIIASNSYKQDSIIVNNLYNTKRIDRLVTQSDVDNIISETKKKIQDLESKNILHSIFTKTNLDNEEFFGEIINKIAHKIESKIIFIFEDKKQIENINQVFSELKIEIDNIVSGPYVEAMISLSKKEMRIGAININIGAEVVSIAVFEKNVPLLIKCFPNGGEDFTSDIALGLRVNIDEAENIKCGNSKEFETTRRRLEDIIDARMNFLNEKINVELDRIKRRGLLPAGVILNGESSKLKKIDTYMRYDLKLPVNHIIKNLHNLKAFFEEDAKYLRSYGATFVLEKITESSIYIKFLKKVWGLIINTLKKYLP